MGTVAAKITPMKARIINISFLFISLVSLDKNRMFGYKRFSEQCYFMRAPILVLVDICVEL
jgi:hypothetical protein